MTDLETRQTQRQGLVNWPHLRRVDELPAYTTARDRCVTPGTLLDARIDCDPLDTVRLAAFCGDPWARGTVSPSLLPFDNPIGDWLAGLQALAAKLPPHRLQLQPLGLAADAHGNYVTPAFRLGETITLSPYHDTPAKRWLLVVAACGVARECWRHLYEKQREAFMAFGSAGLTTFPFGEVEVALDAAERWIAEPTQEREGGWTLAWYQIPPLSRGWLPGGSSSATRALLAAADVIGPDRVREVASAAILARLAH